MTYAGRTHLKKVIFPADPSPLSKVDREKKILEGLEEILARLKRPCRIDLRTDLYRLVKSRWTAPKRGFTGQHKITWSLVPPNSQIIEDVQAELRGTDAIIRAAEGIFFGTVNNRAQVV